MHLVPAPAVRLMKRRVSSRPGVYSLMSRETPGLILPQHSMKREGKVLRRIIPEEVFVRLAAVKLSFSYRTPLTSVNLPLLKGSP